jgi:Lamin Tail Domain
VTNAKRTLSRVVRRGYHGRQLFLDARLESPMSPVRSLVLACVVAFAVVIVPAAGGSGTSGLVISQIFGGGGNAGAPYTNDYVEVFNRGTSPVSVSGWTVQYATAAGTSWQTTALAGTIQPGAHQLVQLAGATDGAPLPTPDATGTTNLSAASGKVALVRDTAALTCGSTVGSCSANSLVEDLVGYGTAGDYEGAAAAPGLSSTTAGIRAADGCDDSDVNSTDFAAGVPAPRNSSTPAHPCSSPPPPPPSTSASADASVDVDVQPVLSLALERATLGFGTTTAGGTPTPISERVTVLSNHASGYALSVRRTAFTPADLPLAIQASAPSGGVLGSALAGGGLVPVPIAPSELTIGTTSAISAAGGDVWSTSVGFSTPIPAVTPGRYSATLTFTAIAR